MKTLFCVLLFFWAEVIINTPSPQRFGGEGFGTLEEL